MEIASEGAGDGSGIEGVTARLKMSEGAIRFLEGINGKQERALEEQDTRIAELESAQVFLNTVIDTQEAELARLAAQLDTRA